MTSSSRIPLGRAHLLASTVVREARRAGLGVEALTPVGGVRRFAPDIGDVALLGVAATSEHPRILKDFARLPIITSVTAQSPCSVTAETARGAITLHLAAPDDAGAALVWHTGARRHVERLHGRATRFGLNLTAPRLTRDGGTAVICSTEQDVYAQLELPHIPPELRDGGDEIDAAERGELPYLVSELHIRGDLHMHSTWSDGRNTIADMVGASRQLGYEYIAITDHSERAMSSRKLAAADVPRQRQELDDLRTRVRGIEVLHGIEVDILHDGSLDFNDEVLGGFDIVLASLHDHGGHDGARLTERYLRAIRHPLVNIITHPANRSPAMSDGYALDFDALFAAAAETGTALEVDGAPGHLDLDGAMARRAAAAGVTLVIDSDCHRMDALGRQMQFAVGTARRGWIEPQHVLNTRSISEVRAFVARKRARA
jgi:DNA polymerase (family 10)